MRSLKDLVSDYYKKQNECATYQRKPIRLKSNLEDLAKEICNHPNLPPNLVGELNYLLTLDGQNVLLNIPNGEGRSDVPFQKRFTVQNLTEIE